ncbi:MAG TPA: hypothetical protein VHN18_14800 [Micromonosporaceae bacterium]|nr:hypothetical protein [Micromonosporaceae bacterium]
MIRSLRSVMALILPLRLPPREHSRPPAAEYGDPERALALKGTDKINPDEVYTPTGRWTDNLETAEPFPINLSIARLTPRHQ